MKTVKNVLELIGQTPVLQLQRMHSGAAVYAALQKAKQVGPGYRILAIAPDGAEKYMSTVLFGE